MRKVVFYKGHVAEEITGTDEKSNPGDGTNNVIHGEGAIMHVADAGNKRRKSTDDWYETRKENSFVAMFFVEFLSFFNVLWLNQAIVPGNQLMAKFFANHIVAGIAEDSCGKTNDEERW